MHVARSRKKAKREARRGQTPPGPCRINGLPAEILLQILLFSCDEKSTEIFDKALLSHPLLTVCHRWRDLALNAPQFWKNITFRIEYGYTCSEKDVRRSVFAVRQVEKQIELVKNSPANIDFHLDLNEPLTRLFQQHLRHMRLFSYQDREYSSLWNIINAGKGNAYQNLTHLTLDLPYKFGSMPEQLQMPSAENYTELPNLRTLQLIRWKMEFPGTLSRFRAPMLHTLDLLDLNLSTALSIPGLLEELQKFPVLHMLRICTDLRIEGATPLSLDRRHLGLRHLSIMPGVSIHRFGTAIGRRSTTGPLSGSPAPHFSRSL
jgi:hypothetical protein